jgi:hypothetical protein
MLGEHPLQRLTCIPAQMEAVGNLDRCGRCVPDRIGVGTGPITADDLGGSVLGQPCRRRLSSPIRQQIHHPLCFQIDEHRPVAVPPPHCKVVNP